MTDRELLLYIHGFLAGRINLGITLGDIKSLGDLIQVHLEAGEK